MKRIAKIEAAALVTALSLSFGLAPAFAGDAASGKTEEKSKDKMAAKETKKEGKQGADSSCGEGS